MPLEPNFDYLANSGAGLGQGLSGLLDWAGISGPTTRQNASNALNAQRLGLSPQDQAQTTGWLGQTLGGLRNAVMGPPATPQPVAGRPVVPPGSSVAPAGPPPAAAAQLPASPEPTSSPAPSAGDFSNIPTGNLIAVLRDRYSSAQDRQFAAALLEPRMKTLDPSFAAGLARTQAETDLAKAQAEQLRQKPINLQVVRQDKFGNNIYGVALPDGRIIEYTGPGGTPVAGATGATPATPAAPAGGAGGAAPVPATPAGAAGGAAPVPAPAAGGPTRQIAPGINLDAAGNFVISEEPPGADPKKWREDQTALAAKHQVAVSQGMQPGSEAYRNYMLGRQSRPLTKEQADSRRYASRMEEAEKVLSGYQPDRPGARPVPGVGGSSTGIGSFIREIAPIGEGLRNMASTPAQRQEKAAQDMWISGKLRKESGAVIGSDELEKDRRDFFPMPFDDPATIAMKKAKRDNETRNMRISGQTTPGDTSEGGEGDFSGGGGAPAGGGGSGTTFVDPATGKKWNLQVH